MKKATFLIAGLIICNGLSAQTETNNESQVIYGVFNGISKPLRDLPDFEDEKDYIHEMTESKDKVHRQAQTFLYSAEKDGPAYGNDPSTIQKQMGSRAMLPTLSSFAGQNGGGYPPDPSGAAGPNHYVQAVNATPFKVFNKSTGAQIMAPKNIGTLWSPATGNMGDPIIMYDKYADRWFVSQFGASNSIYIAISTTPDPTGTYYTYTYTSSQFPDYLKFSIWGDGYYMTSNQGTDKLFVFERSKMLLGQTARSVVANFASGTVSGFFCPLAADADGGLPPAGTPCPFFWYTENAWGGGNVDGIKYIKATVNWTPTTPTLTMSTTTTIPTAAFDGTYDPSWNDIVQPGTTARLDGIGGVPTYRAQYRRWTGYNSIVLNWGVKISATQRSIKWVELRENTPGTWTLFQEGTYSPDTKSRWVGSIAMDDNGSIALCYARSSSTTGDFPSLGFTGRLASDPAGQMTFAETMVKMGTATQTSNNRFGDYSQTSMDPNGLTFWHTGEYLGAGPRTWIYSFQLPLPTGIEEGQEQINNVTAYQSIGGITVNATNLKEEGELVVDLFDITGKQIDGKQIVVSGNSFETSFSTSNLATGTYLVRVGKMNTSFQKVIKVAVK
jgi:hypothetical protein